MKEHELLDSLMFSIKVMGRELSGGAITSLFTNRKIRDYDLYFKNKNQRIHRSRAGYV